MKKYLIEFAVKSTFAAVISAQNKDEAQIKLDLLAGKIHDGITFTADCLDVKINDIWGGDEDRIIELDEV